MDKSQNPLFNTKKPAVRKPTSFVEALLENGGRTAPKRVSQVSEYSPDLNRQWEDREAQARREQMLRQRHQEVISTKVFDREEEETKNKIKELIAELKKLTAELGDMASGARKAIEEEIVHPGTYHVAFFEALKRFLVNLRKRVSESKNWLAISSQRKNKKNHFWGQVDKSGTKYMLSQERTASTQGA